MSIRFQADADLKFLIVKAVRKREPAIDFALAVDSSLKGLSDPEVLELAAIEGRVVVTHDRRTMLTYYSARLNAGKIELTNHILHLPSMATHRFIG